VTYARRGCLILGLLIYGNYRVGAFHPFYRAGYRKWLETTPWNWRKPLPVGPVYPVLEDVFIIAVISAPGWYFGDFEPASTYSIALGSYLIALAGTFPATGAWGFHIPIAFLIGLAVRLWRMPDWTYSSAILLALVFGLVGLSRSLKHWPWTLVTPEFDPSKIEVGGNSSLLAQVQLGWPFDRLGPRRDGPATWRSTANSFFACVLSAWWFYCILGLAPESGRAPISIMIIMYVVIFTMIHRITRYMVGFASPLSLLARLALVRPIIPSYDQVLIAPIAALFAISTGPWMLHTAGLEWDAATSIALGLAMIALYLGGPDLRRWQLTAKHRVVPAITSGNKTKGGFIQVG
jgi:hypothetical protein